MPQTKYLAILMTLSLWITVVFSEEIPTIAAAADLKFALTDIVHKNIDNH